MTRSFLSLFAAASVLSIATLSNAADVYPSKAVKVVVPWSAGQATDAAARAVTERLASSLHQPFVVENRAGAGGGIGSESVAKSAPDGYTLLAGSTGSVTVNPLLTKTSYDAASFAPAGLIATVPYVLVTAAEFPAKDAQTLMKLLKANSGKYTFASSGNGSIGHLIAEVFLARVGVKATHVPYKGSGGALTDVMGGRVDFMFDSVTSVAPHVKSGRVRAYAISSKKRSSTLPDVAPVAQVTELSDFDLYAWIGLLAPKGTPDPVLDLLNKQIQAAVESPEVKRQYAVMGIEPVDVTSRASMAKLIADEQARLRTLIKDANIKLD